MSVDADELYSVLASNGGVEEKTAAVTTFKAEVKRSFVKIENVSRYFEALQIAVNSEEYVLHAVAFSCICHLVKRVITQDPSALRGPANIALPIIINKFGDNKASIRSTASRVFEDYWMSCPEETEDALRDLGLSHQNNDVKLECLKVLTSRVQLQESKFAFRSFTSPVINLLNDDENSEKVQQQSEDLLTMFFKSAHSRAKQDLARELNKSDVNRQTVTRILRAVGFSSSTSSSSHKPVAVSGGTTVIPSGSSTDSSEDSNNALSVRFITDDKLYRTDRLKAERVYSIDDFREEAESMLPAFAGKESEHNWQQRERSIVRLRGVISGNACEDYPEEMVAILKQLADSICKAVSSLRTTLSTHGCYLVREAVVTLGSHFDSIIEPFLSCLVKQTSLTKKISHQTGAMTVNAMILNTSYTTRYLSHVNSAMSERGTAQAKSYAAVWLRLLICKHHRHKQAIEHNGFSTIEKSLQKGITDANPAVRETMRSAYWAFNEVWPREARSMMEKFDAPTKKALEKSNPGFSSGGSSFGSSLSSGPARKSGPAAASSSRSGIREFIGAKTREAKATAPATNKEAGLGKPGRLGMPQRNRVASANSSANTTGGSSNNSATTKKKPVTSSNAPPAQPQPHPGMPRQISDSSISSERSESRKVSVKSFPTVLELITTDDPANFDKGIRALGFLIRGSEPPEDLECFRPATLPRPDIVSRVLQRLFINQKWDYIRQFLSSADIISRMPQFVGIGLLFDVIVQNGEDVVEKMQPIIDNVDNVESFAELCGRTTITDEVVQVLEKVVVGMRYDPKVLEACKKVVQDERMLPILKKLAAEYQDIEKELHILNEADGEQDVEGCDDAAPALENGSSDENSGEAHEGDVEPHDGERHEVQEDVEMKEHSDSISPNIPEGVAATSDEHGEPSSEDNEKVTTAEETETQESKGSGVESDPEPESEPAVDHTEAMLQTGVKESTPEQEPSVPREESPAKESSPAVETLEQESPEPVAEQEQEQKLETAQESETLNNEHQEEKEESDLEVTDAVEMEEDRDEPEPREEGMTDAVDSPVKNKPSPIPNGSPVHESAQMPIGTEPDQEVEVEPEHESGADGSDSDQDVSMMDDSNVSQDDWKTPRGSGVSFTTEDEEKENRPVKQLHQDVERLDLTSAEQHQQQPSAASPAVLTPRKSVNNISNSATSSPSWYGFESKKQVCMSPLPQREDQASRLFESLINQLDNKTIDAHGFRKLVTIVKGAKNGEAGVTFDTWRNERRQTQLQQSLLSYLDNPSELSESQLNQGLLQLKQLLIISGGRAPGAAAGAFSNGEMSTIFGILLKIAGTSSAKTVVYGALRETQDELVSHATPDNGLELVDTVIECSQVGNGSYNREQKVLVISTLGKLISRVDLTELVPRLDSISSVVIASISDRETYVRKESYPVLVNLRHALPADEFLAISDQLSEGQRHLMEYYCKKKTVS